MWVQTMQNSRHAPRAVRNLSGSQDYADLSEELSEPGFAGFQDLQD